VKKYSLFPDPKREHSSGRRIGNQRKGGDQPMAACQRVNFPITLGKSPPVAQANPLKMLPTVESEEKEKRRSFLAKRKKGGGAKNLTEKKSGQEGRIRKPGRKKARQSLLCGKRGSSGHSWHSSWKNQKEGGACRMGENASMLRKEGCRPATGCRADQTSRKKKRTESGLS